MTDEAMSDTQTVRVEMASLGGELREAIKGVLRELDQLKSSLVRYHERVDDHKERMDATEDDVKIIKNTLAQVDFERVNRVVDRIDNLLSRKTLVKAITTIAGVMTGVLVIANQLIGFIDKVR